jgi:hypothetical protein
MMLPRVPRTPFLLALLALTTLALVVPGCSAETAPPANGTTGAGGGNEETGTTRPSTATPQAQGTGASTNGTAATPTPAQTTAQKQFPPQDHLNKIVVAYTVASEHPELLTGLPCYCPCELYGHGGVIDCHRSQHAAMCNICMDEAIEANQLYEAQLSRGEPGDIAAVQAQVKDRYRNALVAQTAQQLPNMNTQQGQAFLQACSDCHQPPSPAMHTAGDWDASLARMEEYARGSNAMPAEPMWQAAIGYVKSVAAQVPVNNVAQMRQSLQTTVEHLKETEGDAAYYPSVRDDVLDPAWAQRMATAYNEARALPTELLANTPTACKPCNEAGNTNLLACLNSWQAITCETAIEEIEKLVASERDDARSEREGAR